MAVNINVPSQVKTYANLAAFPASGALKTIYIAEDTNKTYRWTGSVYVEVSAAGASGITIGTTAITSGTVGRVLFEGTGNVVQESANLFWDNTNNNLAIGTSTPTITAGFRGIEIKVATNLGAQLHLDTTDADRNASIRFSAAGVSRWDIFHDAATGALNFRDTFAPVTTPLILFNGGNVGINTTTDAGFRLDVNGTARVQGNITSTSSGLLTHSFFGGTGYYALIGTSSSSGQYAEIYRPTSTKTLSINNGDFDLNLGVKFNYTGLFGILIKGSTGNVLINTTTDAGFRLDVNGTARVSGQISSGITGTNGNVGLRRAADGGIIGSFFTNGSETIVKEFTGTGGRLENGFDTTSLKWVGSSSQPRVGIGFNGTINATCHIKGAFATSATSSLLIENSAGTAAMRVRDDLVIILPNLPTSSAGLPTGAIWNDAGTLKIV